MGQAATALKVSMLEMRTMKMGSRTCRRWTECGTRTCAFLQGVMEAFAQRFLVSSSHLVTLSRLRGDVVDDVLQFVKSSVCLVCQQEPAA